MLQNVFYINLDHRTDRKKNLLEQLDKINCTDYTRFEAIKHEDGRLGCTLSHINILKIARQRKLPYVTILEDDAFFLKPDLFKNCMKQLFSSNIVWDVFILGGNKVGPHDLMPGNFCMKISYVQTTTAYMVQQHYYDTLINNMEKGLQYLHEFPHLHNCFAIDKWWNRLIFQNHKWYMIYPAQVIQIEDFSDIEGRTVNYSAPMLNLKENFFKYYKIDYSNYVSPQMLSSDDIVSPNIYTDARGDIYNYKEKKNKREFLISNLNSKEKIKNFIKKDSERKKEIIEKLEDVLFTTSITNINLGHIDPMKKDLTNSTFVIPFYNDLPERLSNIIHLINYISKYFNTTIFLFEWGTEQYFKKINFKFNPSIKYFYANSDLVFSRTIVTNFALNYVTTKVVVINDSDCFVEPQAYLKAQKMIVEDSFKIVHPFGSPPGSLNIYPLSTKVWCNKYNYEYDYPSCFTIPAGLRGGLIGLHPNQDCVLAKSNPVAGVGGILFIDYNTYKDLGFENKYFISYSPEDQERIKRFRRLNLKSTNQIALHLHNSDDTYFQNYLFHMEHPRTENSTINHKYFSSNEILMHCLDSLDNESFLEYLYDNSKTSMNLEEFKSTFS